MDHTRVSDPERRTFLKRSGLLTAAMTLARPATSLGEEGPAKGVVEVSPIEDLMREHGLLDRILLLYDEVRARLNHAQEFPPDVLEPAAQIVRRFVEDYHEKLEEDSIFPRFEKANKLVSLTETLRDQHKAGRILTDWILAHASPGARKTREDRDGLIEHLYRFAWMYRPHKAREDTALFPAFHALVSLREYDELGDQFEDKEHELFGPEGFEKTVETIAKLEQNLGIHDLARFTVHGSKAQSHETV